MKAVFSVMYKTEKQKKAWRAEYNQLRWLVFEWYQAKYKQRKASTPIKNQKDNKFGGCYRPKYSAVLHSDSFTHTMPHL